MLQRVGRTGRARDGHITVLMTEGREEKSWDQANDAYNDVQNALTSNKIFDLYVDGERLLPDHIKPRCEQVEIKAQPLDLDKMTMNGHSRLERKALNESKKEKRKVDIRANAPDDAFLGFRTAGQVAAAKKAKPPAPSQVLRERKAAALLTLDQETELRSRWQCDSTGRSIRPQRFDDLEALPFSRELAGSAHRISRHSRRFDDLIASLRVVEALADGNAKALDDWHDKHSKAFEPKLVQVFRAEDRAGPPPRHRRLKRYPPKLEDDDGVPPSFPFATNVVIAPTGIVHEPSSPSSRQNLFRTSSRAEPDPLADELFGDLTRPKSPPVALPSPPVAVPPVHPSSSPIHAIVSPSSPLQVAKPPSRPLSRTSSTARGPGPGPRPEASPPPPPPPPKRNEDVQADYSIDLDDGFDVDLLMSDSQLLAGAIIRKPSTPAELRQGPNTAGAIIIDDSDDEDAVEVVVSQRAAPAAKVAPPAPAPAPPAAATRAPATEEEDDYSMIDFELADEDFDACIAEAQRRADAAAAAQKRRASESVSKGSGAEPRPAEIMPPPPAPLRPAPAPPPPQQGGSATTGVGTGFRPAGKLAPGPGPAPAQQLVVVPSSSPVRQAGSRRVNNNHPPPPAAGSSSTSSRSLAAPATAADAPLSLPSPAAVMMAPMRRLAVPDSSEASSPVMSRPGPGPGPGSHRQVLTTIEQDQDHHQQEEAEPLPVKALSRLRRGKHRAETKDEEEGVVVVVHDSDEEMLGSGGPLEGSEADPNPPHAAKRRRMEGGGDALKKGKGKGKEKGKGKKKLKLTHKQASKFGIFDLEAVNSSASGSELSSEGYSSENSIDRDFIATTFQEEEDDSGAQAQFYRDSLATQAPPGFGTPVVFGGGGNAGGGSRKWIDQVGKGRRPIPLTPRSGGGGGGDDDHGGGGGGGHEDEAEDWRSVNSHAPLSVSFRFSWGEGRSLADPSVSVLAAMTRLSCAMMRRLCTLRAVRRSTRRSGAGNPPSDE
jgi:hypothetical protein